MSLIITLEGAQDVLARFALLPQIATEAARIAINGTAAKAVTEAKRQMVKEVAFPSGYLNQQDRLTVSRSATNQQLEAVVTGRDRPTSLARFVPFAQPSNRRGSGPVSVMVKPGQTHVFKKNAFIKSFNGNQLLILRLPAGQRPSWAYKPKPLFSTRDTGLWILYGPSVNQVFAGVANDIQPAMQSYVLDEFDRQFTRLVRAN